MVEVVMGGKIKLAGVTTEVHCMVGSGANTETVVKACLTADTSKQISLPVLADQLTRSGTHTASEEKWGIETLPADFPVFGFKQANLLINVTQELFMLFGESSRFGTAGFVVKKTTDKDKPQGLFIAARLADGFTFASLTSYLKEIDNVLKIKEAGFALSSFKADSLQVLAKEMPALAKIINVPALDDKHVISVQPGVTLYGQLMLTGELFTNLIPIIKQEPPCIAVYAYLAKESANTVFYASIENFYLIDTEIVRFSQITLLYKPSNAWAFDLQGMMSIVIDGKKYEFSGALTVTKDKASFSVETKNEITSPLGMFNIRLCQLKLAVAYTFKNQKEPLDIRLFGQVGFGQPGSDGRSPVVLTGYILLINGVPSIVEVGLDAAAKGLGIDDFFTTVVQTKNWPDGFLKIVFKSGRLYYSTVSGTYFSKEYKKGFYVDSVIEVYDHQFAIQALVSKEGIEIDGFSHSVLDFDVVVFTGSDFLPDTGPQVYISTLGASKKFGLKAGIRLFDKDVASANLDYNTTSRQFEGKVTYPGTILGVSQPSIGFAWSKEKGFRITEWPMEHTSNTIDYAGRIEEMSKKISSGQGCKQLVKLVFKELITTKFSVAIKKDGASNSNTNQGFPLPLQVKCEIFITGKKEPVIQAPLDIPLVIEKPKKMNLAGFESFIKENLEKNLDSILEQMLKDPVQLGKFVLAAGLKEAASQTIASLVCRKVEGEKEPTGGEGEQSVEVEELAGEAEELAGEAEGLAEVAELAAEGAEVASVVGGTGGAAAAAAGSGEAAEGIGGAAGAGGVGGIVAAIAGISTGLLSLFGFTSLLELERASQAYIRAQQAQEKAEQAVRRKLAISTLVVTCDHTHTMFASWNAIAGEDISYVIQVWKQGTCVKESCVTEASIRIQDSQIVPGLLYTVKVKAIVTILHENKQVSFEGDWCDTSIFLLEQPKNLFLDYTNNVLTVTWEPVNQAEAYNFVLVDKQENQVAGSAKKNITQTVLTEGLTLLEGMSYTARVQATAKDSTGPWGTMEIFIPSKQKTPFDLAFDLKKQGNTVIEAAGKIRFAFPDILIADEAFILTHVFQPPSLLPLTLALALHAAGYKMEETSPVLTHMYPNLTDDDLADIIFDVFGDEPDSAGKLARHLRLEGMSIEQTAPAIKRAFPDVSDDELTDAIMGAF
ncbi:hypothetical protein DFP93_106155 [Aneurinibacillus soli]|uniref:Fibronectin type III domain protein n=1 Tax=Aneurinibacillus soli TaxID=1500254 RepID=A0A0U5B5V2_9BACL|nr:fibronectin type III domain-containing protein [Aneurinibacillus soli]PYE61961.1 hypothetical protein DFP93_106155 [Aneurinibacillus soli]BAU29776.1 Fibronectin type III domain protein [Aneurinibacillus soli]